MKYYIDFDGVILDTEKLIFENTKYQKFKTLSSIKKYKR